MDSAPTDAGGWDKGIIDEQSVAKILSGHRLSLS